MSAGCRGVPSQRSGSLCKLERWPTGMDPSRCSTSDLADMYAAPVDDPTRPTTVQIVHPGFRHYGGMMAFRGRVTTIVCNDCNPLVRKTLNENGSGRVLVIDGGGSMRCALVGDRLTEHAYQNGWAGIIVNGCVRDVSYIRNFLIGIMALGSHPLKPGKKDMGKRDVPVLVGGATIRPGDWLYADEDGILVSSQELVMPGDAPRTPIPLTIPTDSEVNQAIGVKGVDTPSRNGDASRSGSIGRGASGSIACNGSGSMACMGSGSVACTTDTMSTGGEGL